jgi:hypothetical protein
MQAYQEFRLKVKFAVVAKDTSAGRIQPSGAAIRRRGTCADSLA